LEELDLEDAIKGDIEYYKSILELYRSARAKTGDLVGGQPVETTDQTVRHLENIIRELRALLRDRN
jgi:hypothetical protein